MKNTDILKKTMPFVWIRLLIYFLMGVVFTIAMAVILLLFVAPILNESGSGIGLIIGLIAFIAFIVIYSRVSDYVNYMVKAAHVAVIAELSQNGTVPEGKAVIEYGKQKVKERFGTANVFYLLDKLMTGAVHQLQNMISNIGGFLGNNDTVKSIVSLINTFIGIVLGYVDEAVLGRIFLRNGENAWKGAADGIVLYFQDWKAILKNAIGLVLLVCGFYVVGVALTYGICFTLLGSLLKENIILTIILLIGCIVIIQSLKESFLDSYITISVVNKYIETTKDQTPNVDLYGKAKNFSKKFNKICTNAEAEGAKLGGALTSEINNTINSNVEIQNETPQNIETESVSSPVDNPLSSNISEGETQVVDSVNVNPVGEVNNVTPTEEINNINQDNQ